MTRLWIPVLLLLLSCGPSRAARVVSLNLCADDFLLTLAPEQAAAVTPLARDPALSVVAKTARDVATVRADAESVVALHPDLVLAAPYGAQAVLALLQERGVRIERIRLPHDFAAIRAETLRLAGLLGVPARGRVAVAAMDRTLAAVPPRPPATALLLEPRGWTAGPATLGAAVLRAAGFTSLGNGRQWPLEAIAAHPPDLLVVPVAPGFPSLATQLLRHPALRGIPTRRIDPALLICGGPWTARAVAQFGR